VSPDSATAHQFPQIPIWNQTHPPVRRWIRIQIGRKRVPIRNSLQQRLHPFLAQFLTRTTPKHRPNHFHDLSPIHTLHRFPPARRDLKQICTSVEILGSILARRMEQGWIEEKSVSLLQRELHHHFVEYVNEFRMPVGDVSVIEMLREGK
jgi:hypothetical protein